MNEAAFRERCRLMSAPEYLWYKQGGSSACAVCGEWAGYFVSRSSAPFNSLDLCGAHVRIWTEMHEAALNQFYEDCRRSPH